jgi:hypothetical protein
MKEIIANIYINTSQGIVEKVAKTMNKYEYRRQRR